MIKHCSKCKSELYSDYTFGDVVSYSCNNKTCQILFYYSLENEFINFIIGKFRITKYGIIKKNTNEICCELNISIKDEQEAYYYLNKYLENIIFY